MPQSHLLQKTRHLKLPTVQMSTLKSAVFLPPVPVHLCHQVSSSTSIQFTFVVYPLACPSPDLLHVMLSKLPSCWCIKAAVHAAPLFYLLCPERAAGQFSEPCAAICESYTASLHNSCCSCNSCSMTLPKGATWLIWSSKFGGSIHVVFCFAAAQATMQTQVICHESAGSPMGQQAFPPLPQAAPAPRQPPPSGLQARPFINPLAAKAPANSKSNVAKTPSQVASLYHASKM